MRKQSIVNKLMLCFYLSILLTVFVLVSPVFALPQPSVVFLCPGNKNHSFFYPMAGFMQKAAEDLDIDLEIVYSDSDRFSMIEKGRQILSRQVLPDYLVESTWRNIDFKVFSRRYSNEGEYNFGVNALLEYLEGQVDR